MKMQDNYTYRYTMYLLEIISPVVLLLVSSRSLQKPPSLLWPHSFPTYYYQNVLLFICLFLLIRGHLADIAKQEDTILEKDWW